MSSSPLRRDPRGHAAAETLPRPFDFRPCSRSHAVRAVVSGGRNAHGVSWRVRSREVAREAAAVLQYEALSSADQLRGRLRDEHSITEAAHGAAKVFDGLDTGAFDAEGRHEDVTRRRGYFMFIPL